MLGPMITNDEDRSWWRMIILYFIFAIWIAAAVVATIALTPFVAMRELIRVIRNP